MSSERSRGLSLRKESVRRLFGGAAAVGAMFVTVAAPGVAFAADNAGGLVVQPDAPAGPLGDSTHGCDVCQTIHYP